MFQKTKNITYTPIFCLWPECIQDKKKVTVLDSSKKVKRQNFFLYQASTVNIWGLFLESPDN